MGVPVSAVPELKERMDASLAALVEEANRGEPIWWKQSAWVWGLPTWSTSGRPFRGLSALILWRATAEWTVPAAWREATDIDDPKVVVVPTRTKRGWAPLALTPAPRLGALPFPVPKWGDTRMEEALSRLRIGEHSSLSSIADNVRELSAAFIQALRRHPAPWNGRCRDWTVESLSVAARLANIVADAAYAAQVGTVFTEDLVWERGDVAALFPWESQEPGGLGETADRRLKRIGARVLAMGDQPGQLPARQELNLRLDRVWERGEVLEGYSRILELMGHLGSAPSGDVVLDARRLGASLAEKAARVEHLFDLIRDAATVWGWSRLRARVLRKSWMHRLHVLSFHHILGDRRWHPDRIIPRVKSVRRQSREKFHSLGDVRLSDVGLVRLLDAMGPQRPRSIPTTGDVMRLVGKVKDRSYQRRAIFKADGRARWLDVPNPVLAEAQRKLVAALRPSSPFAGVATAFEPGRSPALQARIHEGAVAAVVMDIADFFGSIRPRHLRWAFHPRKLGATARARRRAAKTGVLVAGGAKQEREALLRLLFAGEGRTRWLPQGAPSSPWAANLAAHPMDRRLRAWARDSQSLGEVRYSRYADDLVLSLHGDVDADTASRFLVEAEASLRAAIVARGWTVREEKTRRWRREDRAPLTLCGVEVPRRAGDPCCLPRATYMRARAAMHKLRCGHRRDVHGLLAWAWGATGQPGWLSWLSPQLSGFTKSLAGRLLAEAVLAGWADSVDLVGAAE